MYHILLYGGLAGALITLIIAIILFIKLDITQVIQDLFGIRRTPKTKEKRRKSKGTGITTNNITKNSTEVTEGSLTTELLYDEVAATTLLEEEPNETTILGKSGEETTLLEEETTLLGGNEKEPTQRYFKKELDIIVVHSEVRI